ncbi:MAG: caspase family protein [Allosphingosinicella sp.]
MACGLVGIAAAGPREDGNAAVARGDYAEAMRLYRVAADQGDPRALNNIGNLHHDGLGVRQDYGKAMRHYRLAADRGVPQAQLNLGMMYSRGSGVAIDHAEAMRWLRLAADQGLPAAQTNIGTQYITGVSVGQDYGEAMRWLRRAADQGYATAQSFVGLMYANGLGVRQDGAEGIRWMRLAAAQADPMAQNNLGDFYAQGNGVPRDDEEAVRWFRLAAAQGYPFAQRNLAIMLRDGRGVAADLGEAVRIFRLAAAQGDVEAATAIRELGSAALVVPQAPSATAPAPRTAGPAAAPPTAAATPPPAAAARPAATSAPSPRVANGRRVALVVGISSYAGMGNLPNPVNDARALAAALGALGFDVDLSLDPDQRTLKSAISRLGERMGRAGPGTTGLFFFAGHGIQSRGTNYLIPSGAAIQREADLELEAVSADTVLLQMQEAGVSTNIIILDACRNMPLTRSFRNAGGGLAQMDAPNGTFISYSTAPGSVAADGAGANSPFAEALMREMSQPSQPIEVVFRNVRRSVLLATEGEQTPWDASSLVEPFFFVSG